MPVYMTWFDITNNYHTNPHTSNDAYDQLVTF